MEVELSIERQPKRRRSAAPAQPWTIPGTGAQDPPPALTPDEQIRAIALSAVARMFTGKPPNDPDVAITHAAQYERWIRTGIVNPGYPVRR